MSAFVCSARTIAVLADRIVARFDYGTMPHRCFSPADLAEKMVKLNLKSVGYRYDLTPAKACKKFTGKFMKWYIVEVRELTSQRETGIEIDRGRLWGAAECFTYQACEHPGALQDKTYRIVESYGQLMERECKRLGLTRTWGEIQ